MKKFFTLVVTCLAFFGFSNSYAFEISFRTGPTFDVTDWPVDSAEIGTQYKLGINMAHTSKGAESGFYSSTSIDISLLQDTTIVWITPEFQYDIKLGSLPLYIYPKLGIDIFFAWYPGSAKGFGFGIKPALGAKFDLLENIFVWFEPVGLNIIFAQYFWNQGGFAGFVGGDWDTSARVVYDLMFGVGFRV